MIYGIVDENHNALIMDGLNVNGRFMKLPAIFQSREDAEHVLGIAKAQGHDKHIIVEGHELRGSF